MKNILMGLLLLSSVTHKIYAGLPGETKSSSPKSKAATAATTQAVTADDLVQMHKYLKVHIIL